MATRKLAKLMVAKQTWDASTGTIQVGRIARLDTQGRPWVDFSGNPGGPVVARMLSSVSASSLTLSTPVLLVFEDNDLSRPIVLGMVLDQSTTVDRSNTLALAVEVDLDKKRDALIDERRVVLEAREQVVLRCGKCSITLTRDGKVSIKGQYVINQAVKANRIKGGTVEIN